MAHNFCCSAILLARQRGDFLLVHTPPETFLLVHIFHEHYFFKCAFFLMKINFAAQIFSENPPCAFERGTEDWPCLMCAITLAIAAGRSELMSALWSPALPGASLWVKRWATPLAQLSEAPTTDRLGVIANL